MTGEPPNAPFCDARGYLLAGPSMTDAPFHCPPDTMLDVPVPPSVNSTRRVNKAGLRELSQWKKRAGMMLIASGQFRRAHKGLDRFEVTIVLCETLCRLDLDNTVKHAIDYLRELRIVTNDGPKQMRKVTIAWGLAPAGCRITVRPCE